MKYLLILSFYHLFIIPVALSTHSFCHPSVSQLFISMIHPLILSLCHTYVSIISLSLYFSVYQISGCGGGRAVYLFVFFFFSKIHFYVKQLIFDITIIKSSPLVICCPHGSAAFFLSDFQHFLPPTIKLGQIIIVRNFLRIHQKLLLINIIIIIILLNMYLTLLTLQNILLH